MIELSLRFTSDETVEDSPIQVDLFRSDTRASTRPQSFEPPLTDKELAELRWYLEQYAVYPTPIDTERAEEIEANLEEWGRKLRDSIIPTAQAGRLWQQFVDAKGTDRVLTIDATDPRVLRLPWELLADPDLGGHLFSMDIPVRRRLQQAISQEIRPVELPVRMLVVVSRPDDADFIPPRAISLPLLDALDELGSLVQVEFLYPPTAKALSERLRDRKAPPVHVVHFDGHGVYDTTRGMGYLLFEDPKHKEDRVDANRLGTLLNQCGVPLMVLNACQSAKQEETNPYASVAARLIRSGMGSVLAMNYSVLVVAARKFIQAFYEALAEGHSVGQAIDEGRYTLYADTVRETMARSISGEPEEYILRLRDWFLPALYQQAGDPVLFKSDGAQAPEPVPWPRALTDPSAPGSLPAEPGAGFHGRGRELLKLERALAERRIVVLHGFGGLGKTALAAEAGRWFYRTGRFPGGAAFVSFEHGGSLQQLCSWVGQAVSGDPDFSLGQGDPVARVGELLAERPSLVILDNFESVLGRDPLMPPEELHEILDAVWSWVGGGQRRDGPGSRVLITTRETAFNDARFRPSKACVHIGLEGLSTRDALELAKAVLDNEQIDRSGIDRQALEDLMDRLGGHPLSLYLVLPHLREMSADQITARFEELLPDFETGAAKERNESLRVSLEFSLDRLGEETRAALPDLGVFQGGAFEDDLLAITGIDPELWATARAELEAAALVAAERIPDVTPPFLRFHPTLAPYLAAQLSPERRDELLERYWRRYYGLSGYLYNADSQTPHQARAIALLELPNLRRAFDLCLAAAEVNAGEAEAAVDFADRIARFLGHFGRWRERDAMLARIDALELAEGEGLTRAERRRLTRRGETLCDQGRAVEAEAVFRQLLARMDAGMAYGGDYAAYDRAQTLRWLGRCLRDQGRAGQAIEAYRQALAGFQALGPENESARREAGGVYTEMGDCLRALGRFPEAREAYESALEIDRELGDLRGEAVDLGQLGTLALLQRDLAQAWERFQEALSAFRALGEPRSEAVAWHQLGMVAEEAEDWEEAERCYRESLKIKERLNDLAGMANTCNQLGLVAKLSGRPQDAVRWYETAIEINQRLDNRVELGGNYNNLANLYLSQGRLEEAERYARQAREIDEELADPSTEPWKTYNILAKIAQAQGRADEAAEWRRREQEAYAAYAGAAQQLPQWAPPFIAAVVAAAQGDQRATEPVQDGLARMRETNDWRNIPPVVERILEGERDADALCQELDHIDALIVRTILAQLSGEAPPEQPGAAPEPPAESQPASADDPVQRIRQQWAQVIAAAVAAAQGTEEATQELAPFLDEMGQTDAWRDLIAVLRRIMDGERDPDTLLAGLDATDTLIAGDVLQALGVDVGGGEEEQGITPEQLVDMVGVACQADAPEGLAQQLFALTSRLAVDANAPGKLRALGRALNHVLAGERDPDLSGLPEVWADMVRDMLAGLG